MIIQLRIIALLIAAVLILNGCGPDLAAYQAQEAAPSGEYKSFGVLSDSIPEEMPAGAELIVPIVIINNGLTPWNAEIGGPYFLSYHWKHPGGQFDSSMFWGARTPLPGYVAPGEILHLEMQITVPEQAKFYDMTIDIVQGEENERRQSRWFEEQGWHTYNLRIEAVE